MDRFDRSLFLLLFIFLVLYGVAVEYWLFALFFLAVFGVFILKLRIFIVIFIVLIVTSRVFLYQNLEYNKFDSFIESNQVYEFYLIICGEPDIRLSNVNYIVCVKSINGEESGVYMKRLLLKLNLYPKYKYGDELLLFGNVTEPFETEDFSYKEYLKIFKVDGVIKPSSGVEKVAEISSLKRSIYDLKFYILAEIEKSLDEPYASLVNGLLLGSRKGFTQDLTDKLAITGLTHIVAVSGYNVSLVILFIERMLFFIPRNIRFYIMVVAIAVFAVLAGLSASVIRACIMGVIAVSVIQYGYSSSVLRALLLTASLMILYNPAFLYVDLGFQLSFYATLGILYLVKYFEFAFVPNFVGLREALRLTVVSQIATLPTVLFYFGNLSIVSPIANMLVAPMLPLMMFFGFLITVFSKFSLVLSVVSFLNTSLGFVFFYILDLTANLPYAMVKVPTQKIEIIGIIYLGIVIFLFGKVKSSEKILS